MTEEALLGLVLRYGQDFQESLSKTLQDTEDDQYLGEHDDCKYPHGSNLLMQDYHCGSFSMTTSIRL